MPEATFAVRGLDALDILIREIDEGVAARDVEHELSQRDFDALDRRLAIYHKWRADVNTNKAEKATDPTKASLYQAKAQYHGALSGGSGIGSPTSGDSSQYSRRDFGDTSLSSREFDTREIHEFDDIVSRGIVGAYHTWRADANDKKAEKAQAKASLYQAKSQYHSSKSGGSTGGGTTTGDSGTGGYRRRDLDDTGLSSRDINELD